MAPSLFITHLCWRLGERLLESVGSVSEAGRVGWLWRNLSMVKLFNLRLKQM